MPIRRFEAVPAQKGWPEILQIETEKGLLVARFYAQLEPLADGVAVINTNEYRFPLNVAACRDLGLFLLKLSGEPPPEETHRGVERTPAEEELINLVLRWKNCIVAPHAEYHSSFECKLYMVATKVYGERCKEEGKSK